MKRITGVRKLAFSPHLLILFLFSFVLLLNVFSQDYRLVDSKKGLLAIDKAQAIETIKAIAPYTDFIEEDVGWMEMSLNLAENDNYLTKDEKTLTEASKLEKEYLVQKGETISGIANKFNMHVASLADRNGLGLDDLENIKPGQKLIIPAKDTSDSMNWLAELNNKKEEQRQRQLAEERKRLLASSRNRNVVTRDKDRYSDSSQYASISNSGPNPYPYGWCTWYAAQRKGITARLGNGGQWLRNARAQGYATGYSPQSGAVIITTESWFGHVGIVESVNGNDLTISEMNYNGWGRVSTRTINANNPVIKGYIY